jgi:hypothetical protein
MHQIPDDLQRRLQVHDQLHVLYGWDALGADYLLIADAWNAKHPGPPELMGQFFHLFESPNRFGLPAFYTLHVWAWKDNPNGTFTNWNPDVSCDAFNPK